MLQMLLQRLGGNSDVVDIYDCKLPFYGCKYLIHGSLERCCSIFYVGDWADFVTCTHDYNWTSLEWIYQLLPFESHCNVCIHKRRTQ